MKRTKKEIEEDIIDVIEALKYYISMDGGLVDFYSYDEITQIATIKIGGACIGCPLIDTTYHDGLVNILINEIPEVKEVKIIELD